MKFAEVKIKKRFKLQIFKASEILLLYNECGVLYIIIMWNKATVTDCLIPSPSKRPVLGGGNHL